ncbi:MAG: sporulation integral membrane protein YtvI [Clostridia bacterium]|nr:sporulation integral membrane protein YtvI [Clostridia bacterium]
MKAKIDLFSKIIICVLGAVIFGYIFFKHLFFILLPFLIAWGMAFAVRPPAHYLSSRIHVPEGILRLVLSLGIGTVGLGLSFFLIWKLLLQGWRILTAIGEDGEMLAAFGRVMDPGSTLARLLPEGISEAISGALEATVSSLTESFASFAARFVGAIPTFFIFLLVTLISAVYFALDLERVNSFVKSALPKSLFSWLVRFKDGILSVGVKYAKAYVTIMLITFALIFTGLLLLGAEYAFLASVVIAVLDVLPVIGIGTILVPWAVFHFFFGSRAFGIGLVVLFLIAEFVRQLLEPKIMGKNLGLHPIVSLVLLFASYSLFGILGILLIPCAVVVINALIRKKYPSEVKEGRVDEGNGA